MPERTPYSLIIQTMPLPDLQEHILSLEEQRKELLLQRIAIEKDTTVSKIIKILETKEIDRTVSIIDLVIEETKKQVETLIHLN